MQLVQVKIFPSLSIQPFEPTKPVRQSWPRQPVKLDCAVCAIEPFKLLVHFVQLNYSSQVNHFNYFNQLRYIVQFVQLKSFSLIDCFTS